MEAGARCCPPAPALAGCMHALLDPGVNPGTRIGALNMLRRVVTTSAFFVAAGSV